MIYSEFDCVVMNYKQLFNATSNETINRGGVSIMSNRWLYSAVVTHNKNRMKERHFSSRMAEVSDNTALPTTLSVATSGYGWLQHGGGGSGDHGGLGASLAAPPATNQRTRPVAARSDYRHKTANLPTNDCFSVGHVIRFRAGEIARWCFVVATHNYRSENFVTTSRRPTAPLHGRSEAASLRDEARRARGPAQSLQLTAGP